MPNASDLLLRPAKAADETTIRRLIREAHINPMGVHGERFVVIESPEGGVIACGQVKPHRDGTRELASLVVDRAWRGRGLARRIVAHLLEAHPGDMYLMCASNLELFYEKFGFREVEDASLPRYFRRMKALVRLPERFAGFKLLIMVREGGPVGGAS